MIITVRRRLLLQQCLTCVSGKLLQTSAESQEGSLCLPFSSGWEVFFGRRDRRKQKAVREGEQLATANPPSHRKTVDNGGHWSICFYISFFVLFFPHCAAGRCFTFSFACSVGPLSSHLFRHLPGQQFLLFMSLTQGGRGRQERKKERDRGALEKTKRTGIFFFSQEPNLVSSFLSPPSFIHSFPQNLRFIAVTPKAFLSIRVQPTLTPPSSPPTTRLLLLLAPLLSPLHLTVHP